MCRRRIIVSPWQKVPVNAFLFGCCWLLLRGRTLHKKGDYTLHALLHFAQVGFDDDDDKTHTGMMMMVVVRCDWVVVWLTMVAMCVIAARVSVCVCMIYKTKGRSVAGEWFFGNSRWKCSWGCGWRLTITVIQVHSTTKEPSVWQYCSAAHAIISPLADDDDNDDVYLNSSVGVMCMCVKNLQHQTHANREPIVYTHTNTPVYKGQQQINVIVVAGTEMQMAVGRLAAYLIGCLTSNFKV